MSISSRLIRLVGSIAGAIVIITFCTIPAYALSVGRTDVPLATDAVTDPATGLVPTLTSIPTPTPPAPATDGAVDPVKDVLHDLLPASGPAPDGGNDEGPAPTSDDPTAPSHRTGTAHDAPSGAARAPRSTHDSTSRPAAPTPYGSVAGAALLRAAGRALDLGGSLAVPVLFGIGALGFLIAVGGRSERLLKGDRVPFRRSYRI
ncbi:MAG: hypothetical protein ABR552_07000 [Actinomycetota bacterium]